jgi:hypothetical protein
MTVNIVSVTTTAIHWADINESKMPIQLKKENGSKILHPLCGVESSHEKV